MRRLSTVVYSDPQPVCCELGAGVRKDPQRAMTWYKKAAALGETPAMFKLGGLAQILARIP